MLVLLRRPPWNGRYFAFRKAPATRITEPSTQRHGKLPHDVLVSFVKAAHMSGAASDQTMNQRKRLVLPEWHEMNFVVHEDAPALRIKKQRAVVRQESPARRRVRCVHRWFPFDGT